MFDSFLICLRLAHSAPLGRHLGRPRHRLLKTFLVDADPPLADLAFFAGTGWDPHSGMTRVVNR